MRTFALIALPYNRDRRVSEKGESEELFRRGPYSRRQILVEPAGVTKTDVACDKNPIRTLLSCVYGVS